MKDGRKGDIRAGWPVPFESGPEPKKPSRRPGGRRRISARAVRAAAAAAGIMLLAAALLLFVHRAGPGAYPDIDPSAAAGPPPAPSPPAIEDVIRPGETLSDILGERGLPAGEIDRLVRQVKPVFNLARIVAGRPLRLQFDSQEILKSLEYPLDDRQFLLVRRDGDDYTAETRDYPIETRLAYVDGVIEEHLYGALLAGGESGALAMEIESVFGWDIDFWAGLRKGDAFRLVVEKRFLEGVFRGYGPIRVAEFWNDSRLVQAFRFEYAEGEIRKSGYFHPDGRSLRKEFLKSPLLSYRITSRFTASRLHPIRKVYRAHYGVDYAAPVGTPVFSTADGRVLEAGWSGASGRMVRISHKNGYETMYLHLSRFAVKAGQTVTSGQKIGEVGSSGESTGPHLDYRIKRFGSYLNPLSAKFMPVEPLPAPFLPEYRKEVEIGLLLLEAPRRAFPR